MTQSVRIRRDGDRIVLDDVLVSTEYAGVLKSASLDAEAAVDIFTAGLLLARQILRERRATQARQEPTGEPDVLR